MKASFISATFWSRANGQHSNIVGCYILRPFTHTVPCCCVFMGVAFVWIPLPTRTHILFGFWQKKEYYLFINHMSLVSDTFMNVVSNALILLLQFFSNKVSHVHQLEKKLMKSNNKYLAD